MMDFDKKLTVLLEVIDMGPLAGIKVVEIVGIAPDPAPKFSVTRQEVGGPAHQGNLTGA
jgi:hypothetical protein